jgi:hypothetical protein
MLEKSLVINYLMACRGPISAKTVKIPDTANLSYFLDNAGKIARIGQWQEIE